MHAAELLFDTGPPNPVEGYVGLANFYWDDMGFGFGGFLQQQYLATSFTLDSDATISSFGAFLYNNGTGSVTYQLREGIPPG